VDGALTAAPPQLGSDAAHRVSRAVRVQLARGPRRLPAAEPPAGPRRGGEAL